MPGHLQEPLLLVWVSHLQPCSATSQRRSECFLPFAGLCPAPIEHHAWVSVEARGLNVLGSLVQVMLKVYIRLRTRETCSVSSAFAG